MTVTVGPYKVAQGLYNQGNALFGETAGIQCAFNALFAISYSVIKKINGWDQSDLDIVSVNGNAFYKTLRRQKLLTA